MKVATAFKAILAGLFIFSTAFCVTAPSSYGEEAWDRVSRTGELRWGADVNGGAPYVFPDPAEPSKIIGFEIDIMEAISRRLKVRSKLVVVAWDQLVPALARDDFDMVFNGLEVTPERMVSIDFTIPYYFFSQQITVLGGEGQIKDFEDLRGRRVGTLSATLAQRILEKDGHVMVVPYPSPVEVYKDLETGRIDAALQDMPIAAWYVTHNPKLKNVGGPVGEGIYAGGLRKDSPILRDKINVALTDLIRSGEMETIYRKWNLWTAGQGKLKESLRGTLTVERQKISIAGYLPLIFKGAVVTVIISCLSMLLAVLVGFVLCLGKSYGPRPVKILCCTYIEIIRGTPLLIQLYLLYYGLPNLGISLNAFVAAVLGIGFNYAAYEAEIYRAGLLSIPKGQDEAARSLGMTGRQSLWYILIPQAVRTILPPSTSDFIALFKDTSLVSIITVTELTRAYSQAATTTYRFFELGLITAALYFLMSFPLSLWSASLERKRNALLH